MGTYTNLVYFVSPVSPLNTSPWMVTGNNIYNNNSGNVGIGTTTPIDKLNIRSDVNNITGLTIVNANASSAARSAIVLSQDSLLATALVLQMTSAAAGNGNLLARAGASLLYGSGTGGIVINAAHASGDIGFGTGGIANVNEKWRMTSTGHFIAPTDNTYDIGASGATRPRTGYFGTSVITPSITTTTATISGLTTGSVPFAGSGGLISQDNTNFFFNNSSNNNRLRIGTSGQQVQIGQINNVSYSGIWFGNVTPSISNYSFLGNQTETNLNVPSGGVYISVANTPKITVTSTTTTFSTTAILRTGSATAGTAPLKFASGALLTTAEAGAVEFLTDKFYGTITTGAARKEFTLNDAALTSGRVPFATTNGRLTDAATLLYSAAGGLVASGTTTNDAAAAGNIGEEINAIQSTYTNYATTATYQNITSITLTAGDWDLSAFMTYSSNSATITAASNAIFVISTTTASAAGATEGRNISYVPQAALLGTSLFSESISPYRVSISGTTTYYLNTQATFTLGNPQYVGGIRARRMR